MTALTPVAAIADMRAWIDALAARPKVAPKAVGVVGYGMGGRLALLAAGTYPDRIVPAASYHGGGPANNAADSPHLLARRITARIYVVDAIEDANSTPARERA